MAIASSRHTMSTNNSNNNNNTTMSSNGYLLSKNDSTIGDSQFIETLLHGQNSEQKFQAVNRWCKNPRRNRLSTILDVSQRYDVLASLATLLQQATSSEYQYNCLMLLSELHSHIHHYDQRIYLPGLIQCFSSTSTDVQTLACQIVAKQIRITTDIATFLFLYTEEGLKSNNLRQRVKSIELLSDLLASEHQYENLSPILEVLLQSLQDSTIRSSYEDLIHHSIEHLQHILGLDLFKTYLDTYPASLKRLYHASFSSKEIDPYIPTIDTDIDDEEETPRAPIQVSHLRESKERIFIHSPVEDLQPLYAVRKSSLTSQPTPLVPPTSYELTEFHSIIDLMRSKWLAADETNRLEYLERFKQACEKYLQIIRNQHLSNIHDTQFHQVLHRFLTSILDLLNYLTSSNLDLSIKLKLVLSTCLGWLIKQAQVTYCKKNYKTICAVFKNILLHGQSNNRQLAKLSVSLILLLENFVQPQFVLNELIDDNFQYLNYRIQLEMLAIVTATLIKYRQHHYENLTKISKEILPMLVSNRRELRHGALECFTMIFSYFNSYRPISLAVLETNASMKLLFTLIESVSHEAFNALRFRLQRNLLPSLTDEGNITPGLVCDATTMNDPDVKFILLVTNPAATPQPLTNNDLPPAPPHRIPSNNNKALQLAIPTVITSKTNPNDLALRTRDLQPLKTSEMDLDVHRLNTNHRQQQSHQTAPFIRRMILPNKRPVPIATVVTSTAANFDLALTGNRPLALTEKVFPDDWNKKSSKESLITQQKTEHHHNNTLQFRPLIPRRSSLSRFPVVHHLQINSQTSAEPEAKSQPSPGKQRIETESEQDEGIDSAIESRSLSINTSDENDPKTTKKPARSVHSSSTRRKAERLFSTGSEFESSSARTITPENSNESGVYSQSGREIDTDSHDGEKSTQSFSKDQLFSTRPRLARSGSKSKLDRSQLPPPDPSLSSRTTHHHDTRSHVEHPNRSVIIPNPNVEIIGKGYTEEKTSPKPNPTETMEEKNSTSSKSRSKIIKGSVVIGPLNTTTHTNVHYDENANVEDPQDIGVVGKAVHLPQRTRLDSDRSGGANPNKMPKRNESFDIVSDEFDSDSKENENFADMNQSLSASFRLRIQQKTQEKIEQKERRRQDREIRRRQLQMQQPLNSNSDLSYDTDVPLSSSSTSRYSSQPDLVSLGNDLPPTVRRAQESNGISILPNVPSQQRFKVQKNSMSRSQTFNNRRDLAPNEQRIAFTRPLSEDRITDKLRNPEMAYREAMESVGSDDWERKCSGLGLLQRLIAQYSDVITQNLHQVVLVLIQEVKNLRSQVARFALATFCDMFIHLKRNMDIELDLTVKAVMQKTGESNEFLRSDAEKCLQSMIENVSLQKALQALIAGGASHRNVAIRKTSAKYIYLVCEKLGPTKILNGTRDITERVLQVAASFASDGPSEIRWYGKKIYHMLMPFDELDTMMKHYLNPTVYTNMSEILDHIRTKGGVGETPSDSARNNGRRAGSSEKFNSNGTVSHQFSSGRKLNNADQNEQVRDLTKQMRSSDFRERLNGIEEFQKLCELETESAIQFLVPIFDGFNECLADTNSKVLLKALNTMHQLIPILADALSGVVNSTLPIVAQNIASKNREISQVASEIIDTAIEYIDCGCLLQPLCTLSQNSNLRVRPEIVLKLATLVPRVCQRKPKQVEIHLLPTYWKLLALLRGQNSTAITSSAGGSNSLNTSIHVLTTALYAQYGSVLIDKASSSSMVTPKNLQMLKDLCANIDTV